jgi:hypothetical protein
MSTSKVISVARVSSALLNADQSDYYSSDGATWDKHADNFYFYGTSDKFKDLITDEAKQIEFKNSAEELQFSDEFIKFISRIEDRLKARVANRNIRSYKTMISYSYDDLESGKHIKKYLDLKTASDSDLKLMLGTVPEAAKEIVFRDINNITVNNNNNQ